MQFENNKIKIVRKILALLQLIRTIQIGWCYYHYQGQQLMFEEVFYWIVTVGLLVMLFTGKYLTAISLLCALVIPKFDMVFVVPTIADNLFSFMCLFFAAHHHFINRDERLEIEVKEGRLNVLYWLLFLSYGVINLLSNFTHIIDPYWVNGTALEQLLMSSSLSRFFPYFRELHSTSPEFGVFIKINTWGVIVSQFLLIPLYIFKRTRNLLIIWAIVVLIFIFGLMTIVILPHYTILLFILVFYRKSNNLYGLKLLNGMGSTKEFQKIVVLFYALILLHISIHIPMVSKGIDRAFWIAREWDTKLWFTKKMYSLGFGQPSVLNTAEIEASNQWITIEKIIDNKIQLVPFISRNGTRLNYYPDFLMFGNQGSDYIKKNLVSYGLHEDTFTYLNSEAPYKEKGRAVERLIKFDYSASFHHEPIIYEVKFYKLLYPGNAEAPISNFRDTLYDVKKYMHNGKSIVQITH